MKELDLSFQEYDLVEQKCWWDRVFHCSTEINKQLVFKRLTPLAKNV